MADMDYQAMLERAKDILPDESQESSRFEIPKVKGHLEGSRTVINNWAQIAGILARKPEHLLKYVQKELATPGEIIKDSVVFGTKMSAAKMNEKIVQYADEFVFCRTCGKPETKLTKEANVTFVICQACGAKNPAKSRI
jgi:translation initiation factor 2 subunit 2